MTNEPDSAADDPFWTWDKDDPFGGPVPLVRVLCKQCGRHMLWVMVPQKQLHSNRAAVRAARFESSFHNYPCECGRTYPDIKTDLAPAIRMAAQAHRERSRPHPGTPTVRW